MLLFSLVLIYLSALALSTLIPCLLSFLLAVCVTPTFQVVFLTLMLKNGYERRAAGTAAASAFSARPVTPVPHPLEPAYHATASVASGSPTL